MSIAADKQKLVPGRRVELFDLDLSLFETGLVYRFCAAATSGSTSSRKVLVQTVVVGAVGVNEQQLLTLASETDAGTFTLTYSAVTSDPLTYAALTADIQAALDDIIGAGKTQCSGISLRTGGVTVEFIGELAATNVGDITTTCDLTSPDVTPLWWQGNAYTPIPISAEGFEISGRGALPTPTIKISNVGLIPSSIISEFGDPVGSKLTRWVTYSHYLDDGPLADPNEHYLPEIWVVERKKVQNRLFVEFELSAAMDQQGRKLPGRQVIRDACILRYRTPIPGRAPPQTLFEYNQTDMGCPWAGQPRGQVTVQTVVPGGPSVNEQQRITVGTKVTQGTFTLRWGGISTASIAYNASHGTIYAALLAVLGVNFSMSSSGSNPLQNGGVLVIFASAYGNADVEAIVAYPNENLIEATTEGPFFLKTGKSTGDYMLDQCGKKLSDCKSRFNLRDRILPFGGFPGISRIKVE